MSDCPGMMSDGETSGPCVEPWPPPRLISVALTDPLEIEVGRRHEALGPTIRTDFGVDVLR